MISYAGLILGLRPANERRRYKLSPSLIGWRNPRISPNMAYTVYLMMIDISTTEQNKRKPFAFNMGYTE